MEEGTSNEDHTPPDELMSDNEVILYEITDENCWFMNEETAKKLAQEKIS